MQTPLAFLNDAKRITVFAGHYGSGKTNAAINYALALRDFHDQVMIADLDIVNPYFRTKDGAKVLEKKGIRLISSPFANSNVDTPALPPDTYAILDNKEAYGVLDVGGDDRGALALGRYVPSLLKEQNYEMLLVINRFRPLTQNAEDTEEIVREIEQAAGLSFTGIVHNSNLGYETTAADVLHSIPYAEDVSKRLQLPIRMTTVSEHLCGELTNQIENLLPMTIYVQQSWEHGV
ncbi:MAG: hypothetical protein J6Z00_00315 [Clostridia bacterium]|nr:hypothetical protein [Clostridia bacterium]